MLRPRSLSFTTLRRADVRVRTGSGSGSGSGTGGCEGLRGAPRPDADALVRLLLPFADADLFAEIDWASVPLPSSSSGKNAPGGSIASVSVLAMRAPEFVAILREERPKTETENSADMSMSALLSSARATDADSSARPESLSDSSDSMLMSASCGPLKDRSPSPDFLPDLVDLAEAVGGDCPERDAKADTGGADGVGRAIELKRSGRFALALVEGGG